ncbi:copper resistance protein CopC [Kineosporiaceae bacterium SCSIO 59966]|nr:copper resistance protein CopC [Kineosporiaceae bacterium SCSIO 59966]
MLVTIGATLAVPAVLLGSTAPAAAHTDLRSTAPAVDQTVPDLTEIRLEFTGDVLDLGTRLRLTGPDGVVELAAPVVDGRTVTAAVPDGVPGGQYTLTWRVTAQDGHPLTGEYGFTVRPTATDSRSSASPPATSPASVPPPATPEPTASAAVGPETDGSDVAVLPWALGAGAVVLAAGGWLLTRRGGTR